MREHGSFELNVVDQTLIVKCKGTWNHQTVLRLCEEYKCVAEPLIKAPWACLVDFSEWELSTPDMWDEIDKLNTWGNQNNQRFEVVICRLFIQKKLMENSHTILTNVETHFCDSLEEASLWLKGHGVLNKKSYLS